MIFTSLVFNATENQSVPVCTLLSGSTLARNVTVTLHLSSTEGKYEVLDKSKLIIDHFSPFLVYFESRISSANLIFTEENQNQPLCATVFAKNNQILENLEVYNVSITTEDSAVVLPPMPTSILVFDDDSKNR